MSFYNYFRHAFRVFKKIESPEQKFKLSQMSLILRYLKSFWKKGIIASILVLIVSVLALPTPLLMKHIIDKAIPDKNSALLNVIILIIIGLQIAKLILSFITNYFFSLISQNIMTNIKNDLFRKIIGLPMSFFDDAQTGYIMSRLNEVNNLGVFFSSSFIRIFITILEFILCLIILLSMHWQLTLISMTILPFYYFIAKYYSHGIRKAYREVYEQGAFVSQRFQESITGIEVIKTFSSEERETQKIYLNLEKLKSSNIISNLIQSFSGELLALLGALGGIIVLWFGGIEIIRETFTIGSYVAFAAYLGKLYGPTQIAATLSLTLQPAASALTRITELFSLPSESDADRPLILTRLNGKIEFRNVHFSYYKESRSVLKNISFIINPGEKIAIFGPNGVGKSTTMKLLLGFYEPTSGSILIDERDILDIKLSSLREKISVVSQNTFLFNDTIKNNIGYSNPDASEEDIIEAARIAGAIEFINGLENGFETQIGELGKKLSGGEKQKISIARSILKDSRLIIFDEPTSNLDHDSSERIKNLINNNFKGKTCIIISHNLLKGIKLDRQITLRASVQSRSQF